jgi:hypothetical protein
VDFRKLAQSALDLLDLCGRVIKRRSRWRGDVDLKPALAVVNWATAGVSYPIGKYVVPASLAAGQYEVMAVFPDKTVSKPYWAKMRVN